MTKKTPLEEALSDAHFTVYERLIQLTPAEINLRLVRLDGRAFQELPEGVLLQRKPNYAMKPYDPVRNAEDAFELMQRHTILKDYEPYDQIGSNYYRNDFSYNPLWNPIRFFETDTTLSEKYPGNITNVCICLAALINLDPECVQQVEDAYKTALALYGPGQTPN